MPEYDINAETRDKTRIGNSPYGTALLEVVVYKGGNYKLCFYNGQETTPKKIIPNPNDGDNEELGIPFDKGLWYTLIFSDNEPTSPKRINVSVRFVDNKPPSIAPLSLND